MRQLRSVVPTLLATVVVIAALMLSAPASYAIPLTFVGHLSAANEVPPVASPGTGLATVVLDPTAQTIQINVTFSGLTSNEWRRTFIAAPHSALTSGSPPPFLRFLGSLWE